MTGRYVDLTKTSMYHTTTSNVTVNLDDISRMEWDDEFRSTAVYMKTGKSFMVLENPNWIQRQGQSKIEPRWSEAEIRAALKGHDSYAADDGDEGCNVHCNCDDWTGFGVEHVIDVLRRSVVALQGTPEP